MMIEGKQELIDDENRTSYQTVQTNYTASCGRGREVGMIGADKIVGETRVRIQAIYVIIYRT